MINGVRRAGIEFIFRRGLRFAGAAALGILVACSSGGGSSSTPPPPVPPSITSQPGNLTVNQGQSASFTVSASGTSPLSYQWRKNGAALGTGAGTSVFTIAAAQPADAGNYDVVVSNSAGTATSSAALLVVQVPPSISAQPVAQTVNQGQAVTFNVIASGMPAPTYQWRQNGAVLSGATASSYSIPAAMPANAGSYDVVVSNPAGSVTSAVASLIVNVPPLITTPPAALTVNLGASASFSVSATGTSPLTYQWRKDGTNIGGATAPAFGISATALADAGSYDVVVSNVAGSVTSPAAVLVVNAPPTITSQPASLTVVVGQPASFSVTATGTAPLTYQWKKDGVAISGALSSVYSIAAAGIGNAGSYTVVVANAAGSVTSNAATLTVNPSGTAPTITSQPVNLTVAAGHSASFSVIATGTAPLTYQWRKNGVSIGGATSSIYSISSTVAGDAGSYSVVVSNSFGTVTSNAATLTVTSAGLDLSISAVYITQATQTLGETVPLVKDRNGFIRVFVVASQANSVTPQVRVRFYSGATVVNQLTINAPGGSVPLAVDEGTLGSSWNANISGTWIQPGISMLVDVDPTSAITETDKTNNNFPLSGVPQALDIRTLLPFSTTVIPVTQSGMTGNVNSGNIGTWVGRLFRMYPIPSVNSLVGAGYTTGAVLLSDGTGWDTLLSEIESKRVIEAPSRYYFGAVATSYASGVAGLGYIPSTGSSSPRSAIGWDKTGYSDGGNFPEVFAHEVGHNFGRYHSPCGGAGGPDPSYPYSGGDIGVFGYDVANAALKAPGSYFDIMGYCSPDWISDYVYKGVLDFRAASPLGIRPPDQGEGGGLRSCLLVWGRFAQGELTLEPAFAVQAMPTAVEAGTCLVEGVDGRGAVLFSQSFEPLQVGCAPDPSQRHFALLLPLEAGIQERLAELRISRNGERLATRARSPQAPLRDALPTHAEAVGEQTLHLGWDASRYPVLLVRDAANGNVLSFARGGSVLLASGAAELELVTSDGLPAGLEHVKVQGR